MTLFFNGRYKEAIKAFHQAMPDSDMVASEGDIDVFRYLALVYKGDGQLQKAMEVLVEIEGATDGAGLFDSYWEGELSWVLGRNNPYGKFALIIGRKKMLRG